MGHLTFSHTEGRRGGGVRRKCLHLEKNGGGGGE